MFQRLFKSFVILCLVVLYACGGGETKKDTTEDTAKAGENKEKLQKILADVPEPSELPAQLKKTGADFNEKFANAPANVEKYKTTNFKAALNLGVYATDVGYVSVYEKVQNALEYIKAVKSLGDKLNITSAFDPKLQERFEKNLKNVDSLTKIIDESLAKSDAYLKDQERSNVATLIFAGTFVEGVYIATQLVSTYPKDLLPEDAKNEVLIDIVRLVLDQEKTLGDLLNALKGLEKSEDSDKLIAQLEDLQKLYKALDIQEKIKNNQGGLIITDKTIQGITEKVKEIRNSIVS
ncbi:MAG: hypothetical protein MUE85_09780 [Microscillaceae bacterium]|jgi:hypothetical protein|nr:hypothetical protein [Microscillaceae bacterium]